MKMQKSLPRSEWRLRGPATLQADIVLLNMDLPDISGAELGLQLHTWQPPPHIVFVSVHDRAEYSDLEQKVGSTRFVNKADFVAGLFPMLARFADAPARGTHK